MIGLTDRIRLRPLTAASNGNRLYLASEEAAIRLISPYLERVWTPVGGEPVIGRLGMSLQPPELAVPEQASRQMTQALAFTSAV
jgi:glutamine phosphoribosylpyrophosphate amidotransferase